MNSVEGEECSAIYVQTPQTGADTEPRFCAEIADHAAELAAWQCVEPALADLDVDAALKSILKNPMPFVGNLVAAAKAGFTGFAGNFLTHLKAGLIDWLTGSLPGVYIPIVVISVLCAALFMDNLTSAKNDKLRLKVLISCARAVPVACGPVCAAGWC